VYVPAWSPATSSETETAERIVSKLDDVTWNVEHYLQGRQMTGQPHYSLRVGDYRIIIDWRRDEANGDVLFVRRVGHRSNVYD
jgi:mRNA interferase RelE/StbE